MSSPSASIEITDDGRWSISVQHFVRGVTPAMIHWFLAHRDDARYRRWHANHEAFAVESVPPTGTVGAIYRVRESLGDGHRAITLRLRVEEASDAAFIERSLGWRHPAVFGHRLRAGDGGTHIDSFFLIGSDLPLVGRVLNAVMRSVVFRRARCAAIVAHCRDEFSNLTAFLPQLHAGAAA